MESIKIKNDAGLELTVTTAHPENYDPIMGAMRSYYLQHKNGFNLVMGLLVLLYVNLMLPVMVRRRDYPQSYIEWIV